MKIEYYPNEDGVKVFYDPKNYEALFLVNSPEIRAMFSAGGLPMRPTENLGNYENLVSSNYCILDVDEKDWEKIKNLVFEKQKEKLKPRVESLEEKAKGKKLFFKLTNDMVERREMQTLEIFQ